jgi:hypothetical protein
MVLGECRLPTSFWTMSTGRRPTGAANVTQ